MTVEWVTREYQGMALLEFSLMLHLDYRVDGTEKQWGISDAPLWPNECFNPGIDSNFE